MDSAKQIGNNILFYLNEHGKTPTDLANHMNASYHVINKIIIGRNVIRTTELTTIANYLETSIDNLINDKHPIQASETDISYISQVIKSPKKVGFLLALINNHAKMDAEIDALKNSK